MKLQFTKMHALGNSFIVIDGVQKAVPLTSSFIRSLGKADRGIGFDQCLLIEKSTLPGVDFFYRIFNRDGQEVGQCGNGARCIARFIEYKGLSDKKLLSITTKTTQMTLELRENGEVTVNMGIPNFEPTIIPLAMLSIGNPHAVLTVEKLATAPVTTLGAQISQHPLFPEACNVGFMHILNSQTLELRVYERGVGETEACGSGAIAAGAVGRMFYSMDKHIEVHVAGGALSVFWPDIAGPIFLTGPATFVFDGELCL
jgi:diaminopimelate epimerase